MAANWPEFIISLTNLFQEYATDYEAAAEMIVDVYHNTVMDARTIYTNNGLIDTGNAQSFKSILKLKMGMAIQTYTPESLSRQHFSNGINQGVVAYWTAAQLTTAYRSLPPAHIKFIGPCIVTFPGICSFAAPLPTMNPNELPSLLANAFQQHLMTVQGLHTLIRPPTPVPPYPLPWVGIV